MKATIDPRTGRVHLDLEAEEAAELLESLDAAEDQDEILVKIQTELRAAEERVGQ